LIRELIDLFSELRNDAGVRVVILALSIESSADIEAELQALAPDQAVDDARVAQNLAGLAGLIEDLGKPVIAAIDGQLVGRELELALGCAWRMATERTEFALPEISSGRLPGFGGLSRLPRLIGRSRALELILTGEPIDAREALRIGLIDRLTCDRAGLENICIELAGQISRHAPLAIKYALDAINHGAEGSLTEGLRLESALFGLCFATDDVKEGAQAFLEKRSPVFKGR
jgi:enoyl-CoA hydratase